MTGWPDAMVEDYLNIIRNFALLSASVDNVEERDDRIDKLLTQLHYNNSGSISKNKSMITNNRREFLQYAELATIERKKLEQMIYSW